MIKNFKRVILRTPKSKIISTLNSRTIFLSIIIIIINHSRCNSSCIATIANFQPNKKSFINETSFNFIKACSSFFPSVTFVVIKLSQKLDFQVHFDDVTGFQSFAQIYSLRAMQAMAGAGAVPTRYFCPIQCIALCVVRVDMNTIACVRRVYVYVIKSKRWLIGSVHKMNTFECFLLFR